MPQKNKTIAISGDLLNGGNYSRAILLRLEPDIQDISTKIRDLYTMQSQIDTAQIQRSIRQEVAVQSLSDDIKDLQACQQLIEAQHQQRSTRYESMFREPLTQLFMAQERLELKLDVLEASCTVRTAGSVFKNAPASLIHQSYLSETRHDSQTFQMSASFSRWRCTTECICVCHRRSNKSSTCIQNRFLGALFIRYTGFPYLSLPCDSKNCLQRAHPALVITYFFPAWFLVRALLFSMRYSSIRGPELIIRIPRIVSNSSIIFTMTSRGDVSGLKDVLQQGLASPFDVDDVNGETLLMVGNIFLEREHMANSSSFSMPFIH